MKASCNENHWWDVSMEHWEEGEKEKKFWYQIVSTVSNFSFHFKETWKL